MAENFPWWLVSSLQHGNAEQDDAVQEHDELCEFQLNVPGPSFVSGFVSSVRIPPHFHIIDKVSNSLLDSLNLSWARLRRVSRLLQHAGHTRRHFVKLCVPTEVHFLFQQRVSFLGWG